MIAKPFIFARKIYKSFRNSSHYFKNIDVIEVFLARNFEPERCRLYLEKALSLAKNKKEPSQSALFQKLLMAFEKPSESQPLH